MAGTQPLCPQLRSCLKQESVERRSYRDQWSTLFQALRDLDIRGMLTPPPQKDDQVVILEFISQLSSVSPVHLSQANQLSKKLVAHEPWTTAAQQLSKESIAFPPRSPKTSQRHVCWRWCRCCRIGMVVLLFIAVVGLVCWQWRDLVLALGLADRQDASGHLLSQLLLFVVFVAGVAMIVALIVRSLHAICRCLHPCAAVVVLLSGVSVLCSVAALTWSVLCKLKLPNYLAPWLYWIMCNSIGCMTQVSSKVLPFYLHVIHWGLYFRDVFRAYSSVAFERDVRIGARVLSGLRRNKLNRVLEPFLGGVPDLTNTSDIAMWGRLLHSIVQTSDECSFKIDAYTPLAHTMSQGRKASMCDILRFVFLYPRCLWLIAAKSLRRSLLLEQAKLSIKKTRMLAGDDTEMQTQWQLLVDQYDWYLKNSICLSDILAFVAYRDKRAARIAPFLKSLDDGFACLLFLFCTKSPWVPSPIDRQQDLKRRLAIVNDLAAGRCTLMSPPDCEKCVDGFVTSESH